MENNLLVLDEHLSRPVEAPSPDVGQIVGHLFPPPALLFSTSLHPSHRCCLRTISKVSKAREEAQSLGSHKVNQQGAADLPCHKTQLLVTALPASCPIHFGDSALCQGMYQFVQVFRAIAPRSNHQSL